MIQGSGVVFAGANSYSGSTTISGQLSIRNNLALGAADGTNATGTTLSGGTLTLDGVLTVGGELLTANEGVCRPRGTVTGVEMWLYGGLVAPTAKGTTFTISGDISGNGGVTVDGGMTSGTYRWTIVFSGTNTYLGRTVFDNPNSGTLLVNGTQSSSPIYFGAWHVARWAGAGPSAICCSPTSNPAARSARARFPGRASSAVGSADLRYTQFVVELNGDTAGNNLDNYDQLQVTGTVTLGERPHGFDRERVHTDHRPTIHDHRQRRQRSGLGYLQGPARR